jgi:hypothetical protein
MQTEGLLKEGWPVKMWVGAENKNRTFRKVSDKYITIYLLRFDRNLDVMIPRWACTKQWRSKGLKDGGEI